MSKTTINPEALKNLLAILIEAALVGVEINHDVVMSRLDDVFPQEKEPKWKPKTGDLYWFINEGGTIFPQTFTNDPRDQGRLEFDNFFSTRELAEKRKAQWIALANEEESV